MTVEELKQALEAATPGPFACDPLDIGLVGNVSTVDGDPFAMTSERPERAGDVVRQKQQRQANARLIVAAVNNLPKLVAVAEAAENAVDGARPCLGADLDALAKAIEELNDDPTS